VDLGADVRVAKVKIWNIVAEELQIILIDSQGVILYFDFISTVLPVIEISPTFSGPHTGNALAGYVQSGTYVYANETLAKDACKARVDCNGVTQEPKNYTLRAGSTLTGSSKGEDSWKKTITFTGPHANNALAGYVSSGTYVYANETAAKDACKARVDCNGVTKESEYTLRAGSTLTGSSNGEVSWLITRPESVLDLKGFLVNIRKVRVQLEGTNNLHMNEVQVFDNNGLNVALNKVATQSTTWDGFLASNAVNGNLNDHSHTNSAAGK
jgi:hypothetical protein